MQGVWFYNDLTNFHYSYILYTPLQGFDEIGAITKLVVVQKEPKGLLDIDAEFSVRVVQLKAGVKAHAGPKPSPPVTNILSKSELKSISEDSEQEINEEENNIYWKADGEVRIVFIFNI